MKISKERLRQIIQEELDADLQNEQLLNEGITGDIFGWMWNVLVGLPGGVVENIKEWLGGKVLNFVGIASGTPIHDIGMNFFGNLTMEDVTGIMSGDKKCEAITEELAGAMTEYLAEKVPPMLGFEMDGWLAGAARESMGTALLEPLNQGIARGLCNLDFSSMFSGRGGDEEELTEVQNILLERFGDDFLILNEEEKMNIKKMNLKKGRCTPMGTAKCPEGSPQYNLANRFKSGDIHKDNLKKGKNPHGPG